MSKELRELLNQLDTANKELNTLLKKDDVTEEELTKASNKLDLLEAKVKAQRKTDDMSKNLDDNHTKIDIENTMNDNVIYNSELFVKAIADNLLKQKNQKGLNLTERQMNVISENIDEDGGYAVPVDMQTQINRRLQDTTDLYNLVDYEKVLIRSGSRIYEKRSAKKAMQPLAENVNIPSAGDSPQLEKFSWKLKDLADFMSIPNDLLKFADSSLEEWIINWFVDKVRITRNIEILYGPGGDDHATGIFTTDKYSKISLAKNPELKDFKKIKNVNLKNYFKPTARWIVNQDGFNYLDSLEDKNGNPFLQPDPKQPTQFLFLGLPIVELPNEVLKTTKDSIPMLLGDSNQAYKYVSDGAYELATTNIGAGAFETNTTKARIIMRMDGNVKDSEALLIIQIPVAGLDVAAPVEQK